MFDRLVPPWQRLSVKHWQPVAPGALQVFELRRVLRWTWEARITRVDEGREFTDVQLRGPFARWEHRHRFREDGDGSVLVDDIRYALPLGRLGQRLAGGLVANDLDRMFAYRHARTAWDLDRHARYASEPRLRVAVSGATGLVGAGLTAFLSSGGHTPLPMVRRPVHHPGEIYWNPGAERIDTESLDGVDAVVHLAGEPLAQRWTTAAKARMRDSRVAGTRLLCEALARASVKPRVLVCASAVGVYGDRGDEVLDESSPPGDGFLATLAQEWEAATAPAVRAGIRVVNLRIGIVLHPAGGALGAQLPLFRLGLGGPVGGGRQYVSWITRDDLLGLIHHALFDEGMSGPVNATAPNPVPQRAFATTLGGVLRRPAFLPAPRFAIRLVLGEMGEEAVLAGQRVLPRRATDAGFSFLQPDLEPALRMLLGRTIR